MRMTRWVAGLVGAVVLAGCLAGAQGQFKIIADLDAAVLRGYWNEMAIDEKYGANDPVKFRLGAWESAQTGYLGAIGCDRLEGDHNNPVRREKCLIAFKMDPIPTVEVYTQRTATSTEDRDMVRILRMNAQEIEFGAPLKGVSIAGSNAPAAFIRSTDGRYQLQVQDDGNLVLYNMSGVIEALWNTGTQR